MFPSLSRLLHRLSLLAGLGTALATVCVCARAADAIKGVAPGTAGMAAVLNDLASKAQPMRNPFLSAERAQMLGAQVARDPDSAASVPLHFAVGTELLQAGKNEAALAEFNRVEELCRRHGITPQPRDFINTRLNLALCHLRMGEVMNCLSNHTSQSCLLPIQGGGIHLWQQGSRAAMGILTNLLATYPDDLSARWLLNVACMTVGDYPDGLPARWLIPPATFASDYDIGRFAEVAMPAGLADNQLSGGSVVEDFDNDGFLDVLVTSVGLRDQMRFYHSNGNGTFTDRTKEAGLTGLTGGLNMTTADYDNDGDVDVLVLRGGWMREGGNFPKSLLRNNGDGTFEDVTVTARMLSFHPTQTAAWFDYDGDGWLDLFIGHETSVRQVPHSCELYRNNRDGTFTELAAAAGLALRSYVKGVAAGDYNNDGRPDLFISMQGKAKQLFRNDGPPPAGSPTNVAWVFTEVAAKAGVQEPRDSFPTWFFDYDNDGWEDIYVGGYQISGLADVAADYLGMPSTGQRPKLYHNRGDGTFADVTADARLDRVLHGMGANFGDLDNDGWLDFYLGTGNPDLLTLIPNRMFRNAEGKFFQDVTTSGGFGHLQKGHGISFADVDNDGDQDIHEDMGGAFSGDIYPNVLFANPGHGNHWLKLHLVGVKANRAGHGARLKLTLVRPDGTERRVHRTVGTGASFGCNPLLRQEIGLGDARAIRSLEIRWPGSGTVQVFTGLEPDRFYRVKEDSQAPEVVPLKSFALPLPQNHAHGHKP